mmetsp:Transcript_2941/g.6960  ORF Transcript_2941/g.6960 Transcript_2941/m.6960 type:complete len:550 (-) Transcript_2941:55-1704(-)
MSLISPGTAAATTRTHSMELSDAMREETLRTTSGPPPLQHQPSVMISNQRRVALVAGPQDSDDDGVADVAVKTTIVCTIGPNTAPVEQLEKLIEAGMGVARCNFSHGDHDYHGKVMANVRAAVAKQVGRMCAILLDTKGPEIRTGKLANDVKGVDLVAGNVFTWHHDEARRNAGNEREMYCTYADLSVTCRPGSKILCSDALLSFTVLSCDTAKREVRARIDNAGTLGNTKNMNLPGAVTNLPALTAKDHADITFGVSQDVDIIAASFIRKASDVEAIRAVPGVRERGIAIISKIENQEGLDNFDEILAVSDGIMVARGDLGSEIPIENVAAAQKMMIHKCNDAGKPVVTATQMLDSMIQNPRPTRAEATDVFNAVLDGSDCVMLSGETASGRFPVEAVRMMARICRAAENEIDHREYFMALRRRMRPPVSLSESMASSAVKSAWDLRAPLIVVVTETGHTARLVSKYRPHTPILTITTSYKTAHKVLLSRGTVPYLTESITGTEQVIARAVDKALSSGLVARGQYVPVVFGHIEAVAGGTNAMKIVKV